MTAKIIFIDVDGVLCVPWKQILRGEEEPGLSTLLDDEACVELKRIVDATGAQIVVSSTWRSGDNGVDKHDLMDHLRSKFKEVGIPAPIDSTPCISTHWEDRTLEILTWLQQHGKDVDNWIAIDDEDLGLKPHFIHTRHKVGLDKALADRAIEFLNTPHEEITLKQQKVNVEYHDTGVMKGVWLNGRVVMQIPVERTRVIKALCDLAEEVPAGGDEFWESVRRAAQNFVIQRRAEDRVIASVTASAGEWDFEEPFAEEPEVTVRRSMGTIRHAADDDEDF